jgi:hypothetical protein
MGSRRLATDGLGRLVISHQQAGRLEQVGVVGRQNAIREFF